MTIPRGEHPEVSKTEPDDLLAAYFRQLAEHDLLTPEDERTLSKGIEENEVLTWEFILSDTVAHTAMECIAPNLERPLNTDKLFKTVAELQKSKRASKKQRLQKELTTTIKKTARVLRKLDLDRVHIDAVMKYVAPHLEHARKTHHEAAQMRERFVRSNLRLVVTMARRYDRGGMPLADMIQEGNLGLMHAVSRFDYRRGLRFSTYACWWIRHAIGRALADKGRAVRIPVHMLEAQQQLEKRRQELVGELGRPPTPQELSKAAKVPLAKLNQMHRFIMGQPMSLDRPAHDDDDRSLGDTISDPNSEDNSPDDTLTTQTLIKQMKHLLHHLSPIEADVLTRRFGLSGDEEKTFREIGDCHNLSRERIRQIQNLALEKLRAALGKG